MGESESGTKFGWRESTTVGKVVDIGFAAALFAGYAILVLTASTRYQFLNSSATALSDSLRPYYEIALDMTPNQAFVALFSREFPNSVSFVVVAILNILTWLSIHYLIIRKRFNAFVISVLYILLSLGLSFLTLLIML